VETPRYRTPIDPFLVLLATTAVITGARYAPRLRRQRPPAYAGYNSSAALPRRMPSK
jgi:hypothetical protein